jgi:hypothetical protein
MNMQQQCSPARKWRALRKSKRLRAASDKEGTRAGESGSPEVVSCTLLQRATESSVEWVDGGVQISAAR